MPVTVEVEPQATEETAGVTVYTKNGCPPCKATLRALRSNNIAFTELPIESTPGARDIIANLGYAQAPVVIAGEDSWSGFNPDRIKALITN